MRICRDLTVDLRKGKLQSLTPKARYVELPFFSGIVATVTAERDAARSQLKDLHQHMLTADRLLAMVLVFTGLMHAVQAYRRERRSGPET